MKSITDKKCQEDINECAIVTFKNLGELYIAAEIADISKFSDQEKIAYNRRINSFYNAFIEKESEVYKIPPETIKDDILELRKSMKKLRQSLDSLDNINTAISAISSIVSIITSILSLNMKSVIPSGVFEKRLYSDGLSLPKADELHDKNLCIQEIIEERDFLRQLLLNLTDKSVSKEIKASLKS